MRMFLISSMVIASLFAGAAWSEEWDPEKALGIKVDQVLEGSEPIKEGEVMATGEVTTRGIYGFLIVVNKTAWPLWVSRGAEGRIPLGIVPPLLIGTFPVGDFKGSTKLWASNAWAGKPVGNKTWRRTVEGSHLTYRWTIN